MTRTRRWVLTTIGRWSVVALVALAASTLGPLSADAAGLDEAKRAGWIGERPDGFVGLVRGDAPADVRSLVNTVNAERRAGYEDVARRTGASAREVGILAGRRLIGAAAPGTYVMTEGGQWIRK